MISQAGLHLHDLTAALSDYHTYSEQHLHAVFSSLSPVNGRVGKHIYVSLFKLCVMVCSVLELYYIGESWDYVTLGPSLSSIDISMMGDCFSSMIGYQKFNPD